MLSLQDLRVREIFLNVADKGAFHKMLNDHSSYFALDVILIFAFIE